MGCDIHSMAEVSWDEGETWEQIEHALWPVWSYDKDKPLSVWNRPYEAEPFSDRNYNLFAFLADVRNSYGIKPLAEARGLPKSASKPWKRFVKEWGYDLHSTSWFTLEELVDAVDIAKKVEVKYSGWVQVHQYLEYRDKGIKPTSWSGGVGGGSVVTAYAEDYDAGNAPNANYIYMSWFDPLYGVVEAIEEAIAPLLASSQRARYRIVFGFDN